MALQCFFSPFYYAPVTVVDWNVLWLEVIYRLRIWVRSHKRRSIELFRQILSELGTSYLPNCSSWIVAENQIRQRFLRVTTEYDIWKSSTHQYCWSCLCCSCHFQVESRIFMDSFIWSSKVIHIPVNFGTATKLKIFEIEFCVGIGKLRKV